MCAECAILGVGRRRVMGYAAALSCLLTSRRNPKVSFFPPAYSFLAGAHERRPGRYESEPGGGSGHAGCIYVRRWRVCLDWQEYACLVSCWERQDFFFFALPRPRIDEMCALYLVGV